MKKRILSMLLALALVLSGMPTVFAADIASGTCGDNMTWRLSDSGVLTISGSGAMYDYTIPDKGPWYSYKSNITSVVIEEGVTELGNCAFYMCGYITNVTFPNSLKSLGERCFFFCTRLNNVTLPGGLTEIADYAFSNCNAFTKIVVPEGVTRIGTHAFSDCSAVTEAILPSTLTTIGFSAFYSCLSLYNIEIPENVVVIEDCAFYTCRALTGIALPEGATTIGAQSFYNCTALESVYIPASVNSIAANAFEGCDTTKLAIYGVHNTYAETYADGNGITYNPMHSYDQVVVTAPTCTESGYTTHTCSCGEDFISDLTDALGHDYVGGTCSRCGDAFVPKVSGDVNQDGKVDVIDIMRLKQLILKESWTEVQLAYGDQNGNNTLDTGDMMLIKSIILVD